MAGKLDEPSLRAAFVMMDVDGDGVITKPDLMRTVGSAGSDASAVDEMFAQLNCTSGRLYFGDFLRLMTQGRQGGRGALCQHDSPTSASCRMYSPRGASGSGSARDLLNLTPSVTPCSRSCSLPREPRVQRAGSFADVEDARYRAAYTAGQAQLEASFTGAVEILRQVMPVVSRRHAAAARTATPAAPLV